MRLQPILLALLFATQIKAQSGNTPDSSQLNYLAELKIIGKQFTQNYYPNYVAIHSLPESSFVSKIDSVRGQFVNTLNKYKNVLPESYVQGQSIEIRYYFDKLLVDYLLTHDTYTGKSSSLQSKIPARLQINLADFNKPELLTNSDFTSYVKAFLYLQTTAELKKAIYKNKDNQHLSAVWNLIPKFISHAKCKGFWQSEYLYDHIDNNGIKNIQAIYNNFRSTCKDSSYLNKVSALYKEDSIGRLGHLVKTYKTVGPFNLDMHIFLPDSFLTGPKRPVMIAFHGGSWTQGKPDWFFYSCESYAKKGWIACAVEYRTFSKNGTLPFSAVMDAKSAIRWIRKNADKYNIDTNRIVATGNSAGGHLVLATALVKNWNEKTDDLRLSPAPNVLLVNSGVYDLNDPATAWIRKDLKNKDQAKEISPNDLSKAGLPPTLLIHGTNDRNVPYESAKKFADDMANAKNFLFETLEGAGHFIWYDPKFSSRISTIRTEFLTKLGY